MARRRPERDEDGFVVLQVLGICLIIGLIGGLALDLWRGYSTQRQVTAISDSAAAAGASQIDEAQYRSDNRIELDPTKAFQVACTTLHDATKESERPVPIAECSRFIDVAPDRQTVTVRYERPFRFTLLAPFVPSGTDMTARAKSTAAPR